ncbi:hypothetical protein [Anatilimnocola floriformis]|uniref:hypothetical protein n=1 Tax=Anatilimnocola floriformis TaxID=2948575 RepID=UPI0020C55ABD|nr:hypothetical protein [Anatilimnocola floriformis]
MSSSTSAVVWTFVIAALVGVELQAQEKPAAPKSVGPRLSQAEIKSLVKQLGVAKESERDAAVKKLQAAGLPAIEEVGDAAENGNNKARDNALEILKTHLDSADPEVQLAAFAEVRRLATRLPKSANSTAAAALVKDHPELKEKWEAAKLVMQEKRKAEAKETPPKTAAQPKPTAPADPITQLRRQALEQQLKDGDAAIEKIKKLKLPKDQESQQISAIMQGLQKIRENLKELDGPSRKK